MKKKIHKIIAVYLALNLLFEIVAPTVALALTNGPSQPEMESFEPVGTTQMVDPFSGDFNYNIPLMTVPGPNGGYPINLAYHAGIGMEQEASWVGLGWNINAGEISRQMRGLPDDFKGDLIIQERHMAPNSTATLTGKNSIELLDFDASIGLNLSSFGLAWNSYRGIGINVGLGINTKASSESNGFVAGLHTDYNSFTGTSDLSASMSYAGAQGNNIGLTYKRNSLEGVKSLDFDSHLMGLGTNPGGLTSFSGSSFIPHSDMPSTGFSVTASFDNGLDIFSVNPYFGVETSYSQNNISPNTISLKGFGYMNSQSRKTEDANQNYSLMDFNREKDYPLTKDIPALPMPIFTNDIYFVKGQGVGGAFRPYRSDVGVLVDPVITSKIIGGKIGVEVGTGVTAKVAADLTLSYSNAYSGPWRDSHLWGDIKNLALFAEKTPSVPLLEPYYFKNVGDMTANFYQEDLLRSPEDAFPVKMVFGVSNFDFTNPSIAAAMEPLVDVQADNLTANAQNNLGCTGNIYLQHRQSRSQMMSLKTRSQMMNLSAKSHYSDNSIYNLGSYPQKGMAPINCDYNFDPSVPNSKAEHTAEITVINPDGNRYIYGIPVYNNLTKEVTFSVNNEDVRDPNNLNTFDPSDPYHRLISYGVGDASGSNNKNDDHFYNSKSLPPYAHSYLLTAIVSPDYVDLTGNGLTEDDYGYYTKFNYSKTSDDYKWRSPYRMASYMDGFHSIRDDDKAGYIYGLKEIWYLNSIETKTHVAEFHLSTRADGFGAASEKNDTGFGQALQKVDRIDLFSKSDPSYLSASPIPIKSVNFEYTYDLCGQVENFNPDVTGGNTNQGKLTLKKVWFTFLGNNKGSLSPYEFDYKERNADQTINLTDNPNYSIAKIDRWGNYKPTDFYEANPYVDQTTNATFDANRDISSSVWCLKNILLPSGGNIKIEYESDDYAYVQDQPAMQMAKIVGVGNYTNSPPDASIVGNTSIAGDNLFVAFELKNQNVSVTSLDDIWPYVKDIKNLYFKTFQKLKKYYLFNVPAKDYVSGYAKLSGSGPDGSYIPADFGQHFGIINDQNTGIKYGFLKLATINVHDSKYLAGLDHTNPFRKAGWQYLKLSRPDLLSPSSNNNLNTNPTTATLLQLATATISFFTSNFQLLTGYYNYCLIGGFCNELAMSDSERPSFIRINTPDKIKYGGGHRVKSIKETDTWSGAASINEYGQEFMYRMPDGTSSGVASYEPLIGGEEIPLHQPVRYNNEYYVVQRHDLYMEQPYCESYYPGAHVGYSRVVVKGIGHGTHVTKGTQGVTLYEFYTAKDFPVTVKSSDLSLPQFHDKFKHGINIPFLGNVSFNNYGFSQSFTVETNDMNGKLKSVSTYPHGTAAIDLTEANAVSKTKYIYKTDVPYDANRKNQLNNSVDVLFGDAYHKTADMGLTKEHFINTRERSSISTDLGWQANAEITLPFVLYIGLIPMVSYSENLDKSIVTMNVTTRNGILMETQQLNEGSMVSSKNLMFDAATGEPLLTTVTNNFDKPVYTYDFAAHWAYDGMGAACKNSDAEFNVSVASGLFQIQLPTGIGDPTDYLTVGDEVSLSTDVSDKYWVTHINPGVAGNFMLEKNDTNPYSGGSPFVMTILRSGRRNLQDVSNGNIVSLSNPVADRVFPLFAAWNNYYNANPPYYPNRQTKPYGFDFPDCASGQTRSVNITSDSKQINFSINASLCQSSPYIVFSSVPSGNFSLKKSGNKVYATLPDGSEIVGTWVDPSGCLKECLPDVLHASASEFKDDWSAAIDTIQKDVLNNQINPLAPPAPYSGVYASGRQGIWRTAKTNLYQVDRKRNAAYAPLTDISKDGTFTNYVLFDWTKDVSNPKWTTSSMVSKINPYGYEIENKDALGIFSSALYGYNNSLQTAIASNAQYYEIGFDGFEDYKVATPSYAKHGHINLIGTTLLSSAYAHTGKKSLLLSSQEWVSFTTTPLEAMPSANVNYFTPLPGKKYLISAWYKSSTSGTTYGAPTINIAGTGISNVSTPSYSPIIDGWIKVDQTFTTKSMVDPPVIITFTGQSYATYLDDLRIQPFQSTMKTYVYDPQKLWLMAELDNQNFATFYNYDKEGTMFQVKKETVKGVTTIKTTSSNIKRLP